MKNADIYVRLRQVGQLVHDCHAQVSHGMNLSLNKYDDKAWAFCMTGDYKLLW